MFVPSRLRRRGRRRVRFALFAGLTLLLLELLLRRFLAVSSLSDFCQPSPIPGLAYELKADVSVRFDGFGPKIPPTTIQTSSRNIRDREYGDRPPGVKRVLVIGDSEAFGWGVEERQTFSSVAERLLSDVEIINCSVPGYNWIHKNAAARSRTIEFDPDYVVFHFVANDGQKEIQTDTLRVLGRIPSHLATVKWLKVAGLAAHGFIKRPEAAWGPISMNEVVSAWLRTLEFFRARRVGVALMFSEGDRGLPMVHALLEAGAAYGLDNLHTQDCTEAIWRIAKDGHYNARAHDELGRVLANALKITLLQGDPLVARSREATAPGNGSSTGTATLPGSTYDRPKTNRPAGFRRFAAPAPALERGDRISPWQAESRIPFVSASLGVPGSAPGSRDDRP